MLDVKGDWAEQRPDVRPGGWAFQYRNAHYPDLDDTAVVVMAMDRARRAVREPTRATTMRSPAAPSGSKACRAATAAGPPSTPTMSIDYLNNIPFADHGALLDPPTADVTARCVGMLAQLGEAPASPVMRAGLAYLRARAGGGRKLVRPLGRELHLRHVVGAVRVERGRPRLTAPTVRKAADWLISIQNQDGGWGEDCDELQARLSRLRSRCHPPPRRPPGRCWG